MPAIDLRSYVLASCLCAATVSAARAQSCLGLHEVTMTRAVELSLHTESSAKRVGGLGVGVSARRGWGLFELSHNDGTGGVPSRDAVAATSGFVRPVGPISACAGVGLGFSREVTADTSIIPRDRSWQGAVIAGASWRVPRLPGGVMLFGVGRFESRLDRYRLGDLGRIDRVSGTASRLGVAIAPLPRIGARAFVDHAHGTRSVGFSASVMLAGRRVR